MRRVATASLMVLAAWLAPADGALAQTTVRVLDTWPSGDSVTLGRHQNFYLRLAYDTDEPAGIWVAPYFQGKRVNAGSSPSQKYSGSGETFGWFFFMRPGDEVDEIRITAGDGSTNHTPVVATWRGHLVAGTESAAAQEQQPAWVEEMTARAKLAQDQALRAQMSKPTSIADVALFSGFMLAMLALGLVGFAGPAWGLWRWRGGWRVAAAMPAAVTAFVALRILVGVARDPTSHNLWPFEILQVGAFSAVMMGALLLARRLTGAGR